MPSKFSKRLTRRGVVTSKRGNVTFYKGRGGRTEGVHTTKGKYTILEHKVMRIVAPDLSNCDLKPYVFVGTKRLPRGQRVPEWAASEADTPKTELR